MNVKFFVLLASIMISCGKSSFLNKVSNGSIRIPSTLEELEELLENEALFSQTHGLAIISADEFYCTENFYATMSSFEQKAYIWAKKVYEDNVVVDDWFMNYKAAYVTNLVLEGLNKLQITAANQDRHQFVKSWAIFMRACAFYNVAQVFMLPYDSGTASHALGIPVRLGSDASEPSQRATMLDTYNQIISDLKTSIRLLPSHVDYGLPNRGSKGASYAMLARVFLSMRAYDMAGPYADSCLQLCDSLLDYNQIDASNPNPFSQTNPEVLYQSRMFNSYIFPIGIRTGGCLIDSNLFKLYKPGDLRLALYFKKGPDGKPIWKSGYSGSDFPFSGLALDELYLIKAECLARAGLAGQAMGTINKLLIKRWKMGQFAPFTAASAKEALNFILQERNKELVLRGTRWTDLRRLNKEDTAITLKRYLKGQLYILPPNDNRYALPIPEPAIQLSGMVQNPR